jgi:hypothetical protein
MITRKQKVALSNTLNEACDTMRTEAADKKHNKKHDAYGTKSLTTSQRVFRESISSVSPSCGIRILISFGMSSNVVRSRSRGRIASDIGGISSLINLGRI